MVEVAPVSSSEYIIWQKQELCRLLKESLSLEALSLEEMDRLFIITNRYHDIFSLEDEEQGETSLLESSIDTVEFLPI